MFVKERKSPLKLLQTEALLNRLKPIDHPKRSLIEQDLKKRKAGYQGEKTVDFHLSFLSDKQYLIFNDLRLPIAPTSFQMDSVLVTPYYILPIEIKNISGTLTIDPEFNQLTKEFNGAETGYPDPIAQATRQKLFLQKWFHNNKLLCPPVEFLVVFSNPSTILRMSPGQKRISPYDRMIHAQNIVREISKFNTLYTREVVNLKKIKRLFLNQHRVNYSSILPTYQLTESDLIKGVLCEICREIMVRKTRIWFCPHCLHLSKTAHLQAIEDYFLLIKPTITNGELRKFLQLFSTRTATLILQSLNLQKTGNTKGTLYMKNRKNRN
ncbi:nuclease-related domain-containing protein [Rossellomorea sp. NPDC077527]|uniref:nuclease-related domain-containing protein n=1 Tax=Rossellomorea sp. NPDC077527 TaxID=3364510 RepID=UPI0037CB7AE4